MEQHPIVINLNEKEINEGFLRALGSAIKSILKALFGGYEIPVSIKGSQEQIEAFMNTLNSEKDYLEAYRNYGLDKPVTYKNKFLLNKAVADFERKTQIKWPFV